MNQSSGDSMLATSGPSIATLNSSSQRLSHQDYTVGWICALPSELTAAIAMLDEEHHHLPKHPRDDNIYVLGRVSGHNVVIACLPAGRVGNNSAATVAAQMRYSFAEIQFGLTVGIGGGVPSDNHDIRLGDVVVSQPVAEGRFVPNGSLNSPPSIVLHAVALLQARLNLHDHQLALHLSIFKNSKLKSKYSYQGTEHDQLFEAAYDHFDDADASCDPCDKTKLILRPVRNETEPVIHYGTIASGNQVMRHGGTRDRIRKEFDILWFEMEAAGLMDSFPCLIIRGVCDYADSHKTKRWKEYAAATAAAYAKELLAVVPVNEMKGNSRTNESRDEFALGFHLERVHMIPQFTPRAEYMEALENSLLPSISRNQKFFVLYGLGGIGKTQLAIKFAKDHQHEFTSIFFLDGSSKDSLLKSFAAVFQRVMESKSRNTTERVDLAESDRIPSQEKMEKVLQWLAQERNGDWLLIFDNIDKEPSDEGGFDIAPLFPPRDHGCILITTRLAPLSRLGPSKKVGRMSVQEAEQLLNGCLGESSAFQQEIISSHDQEYSTKQLLMMLDGLPLAISQAGRFINTVNLRLETYLELYTSSKRDVLDVLSSDSDLQDTEKGSIRTTWTTSLNLLKQKATKQGPSGDFYAAYYLLQLFAFFEPSDLNYHIIRFGLIGNRVPDWFQRTFSSKIRFFGVVKILLDLCLIDNNVMEGSYSMHRVVHDWLCTYVGVGTDYELICLAVAGIAFAAPLVLTHHWAIEQQQLAIHAVHILPSLQAILPPDAFLVRYDKMSASELHVVASLLKEPVKCWELMRFEYTLISLARLLFSCGRSSEALSLVRWFQSRCPETLDGDINPSAILLRFAGLSCRQTWNSQTLELLFDQLADTFYHSGSPSWAMKTSNLKALFQESSQMPHHAVKTWKACLAQSRDHTGSIFVHPTWMIFSNLDYRLRHEPLLRRELLERYEHEARAEKFKVEGARELREDLRHLQSTTYLIPSNLALR